MTCENIRMAFENNAPDKYQKHFLAMQLIVHDRSMPDFLKYQKILDLTISAETGLCQSLEHYKNMEV